MKSKKLRSALVGLLLASNSAAFAATANPEIRPVDTGGGSWLEKAECIACGIAGIVIVGGGAAAWGVAAAMPAATAGAVAACIAVCEAGYGDELRK